MTNTQQLQQLYGAVRKRTEAICAPLTVEDYVVQPVVDVSPPKWHLGHTTWFFEEFLLSNLPDYQRYHPDFAYVFNSYYEQVGKRVIRSDRGNLTRPGVQEIYAYRRYVDDHLSAFLDKGSISSEQATILELGLQHEQQHQELLITDIKYILGHNPLFPVYGSFRESSIESPNRAFLAIDEGMYTIGYGGDGFHYDNEGPQHQVFLHAFDIANTLVTNAEYLAFMEAGGYEQTEWWHAEGWDWVQRNGIDSPQYWHHVNGQWYRYGLEGLVPVNRDAPVSHISYFEAFAYAEWSGNRLPTEFEWEVAAHQFNWGQRWEWTESAYLPYPGYQKAEGAIGEYNGKFMVNQKVLRGASVATSKGHSRRTYRNFFHPHLRWQFTGIRLAKKQVL